MEHEGSPPPVNLPEDSLLSYNPDRGDSLVTSFAGMKHGGSATRHVYSQWKISEAIEQDARNQAEARPAEVQYQIRKLLGKGGFGEVWEAEQAALSRLVAIKRIREDLYARAEQRGVVDQIETLFRQEALTAAVLDHPNILPIHDLGADERGRPQLAMKIVKGVPWDQVIRDDFNLLSNRDFLLKHVAILEIVSQAVAFAHSRGIIHRDLKPSQVMIGEFGQVLLMDWGLAACFNSDAMIAHGVGRAIAAAPDVKDASNPAGTAAFMAPEQTLQNTRQLGPWTDVYLLGGCLYHLLTGKLPHSADDSAQVFFKASLGRYDPLPAAADGREVPSELQRLVEHSMEPDRTLRLANAAVFAQRLTGWLTGAERQDESRRLAIEIEAHMPQHGSGYAKYEETMRKLHHAAELWAGNPALPPLREKLATDYARAALGHGDLVLAKVQAVHIADEEARREVLLAASKAEDDIRRKARTRRLAIAASYVLLVALMLGAVSFSHFFRKERDAANEARALAQSERDAAVDARGRSEQLASFMLRDFREKLQALNRLDLLDEAAAKTLDYYKSLPFDQLNDEERRLATAGMINVGIIHTDSQSNLDKAMEAFQLARMHADRETKATGDTRWAFSLVMAVDRIARVHERSGKLEDALSNYIEAVAICDAIVRKFPKEATTFRGYLVDLHVRIAGLERRRGDLEASREASQRGYDHASALVNEYPDDGRWQTKLAAVRTSLSAVLADEGKHAEAEQIARESADYMRGLWQRNRDLPGSISMFESALRHHATQLESLDRLDEARAALVEANEVVGHGLKKEPANTRWNDEYARNLLAIGRLDRKEGDFAKALTSMNEALAIHDELVARDPKNVEWKKSLAVTVAEVARTHWKSREFAAAQPLYERAHTLFGELAALDPSNVTSVSGFYDTKIDLAANLVDLGRAAEALPLLAEVMDVERAKQGPRSVPRMRATLAVRARAYRALGDEDSAAQADAEAAQLGAEAATPAP